MQYFKIQVMLIRKNTRFILSFLVVFAFASFNMNAQQVTDVKMVKTERASTDRVSTFDKVIADLKKSNKKAAAQAMSWQKSRNFKLNSEGNFIPYTPVRKGGNQSVDGNLAASPTNCAKIKCPEVFSPDVVCWECH